MLKIVDFRLQNLELWAVTELVEVEAEV
jgi:hypothetical protein